MRKRDWETCPAFWVPSVNFWPHRVKLCGRSDIGNTSFSWGTRHVCRSLSSVVRCWQKLPQGKSHDALGGQVIGSCCPIDQRRLTVARPNKSDIIVSDMHIQS